VKNGQKNGHKNGHGNGKVRVAIVAVSYTHLTLPTICSV